MKIHPRWPLLYSQIKQHGAKAILQIVSASDIPAERGGVSTKEPNVNPRALTEEEVQEMIKAFGETTRRAIKAGFDGVEIHGANGYLIQQFFSPHSNRREDQFGGSLEKRMTFPLEVVNEVKRVVQEKAQSPFLVGYRFSPEEPETPGITMEVTLKLVDALADKDLDYLHVSLMDFFSTPHRGVEDLSKSRIEYLLETIKNRVPLIRVGSIYTAEDARKAFATGVPLLALGRELIIDPDWVQKISENRENEIVTKMNKDKQKELVIPDPLWNAIINSPGWFPGV
jgi:2,4-dienoyl-CoA reductase-like NADH-dependent reductase (Old Yellow Enzyme family)